MANIINFIKEIFRSEPGVSLQIACMGAFLWFAHFVASVKRYPNITEMVGGVFLAGGLSWVISQFLSGLHLDPHTCASLGAFLGSGGIRTYEILMKHELNRLNGDKK